MNKNLNLTIMLRALEQLQQTGAYPHFSTDIVDGDIVITVEDDKPLVEAYEPQPLPEAEEAPSKLDIRFLYNGLKVNGELYPAYIWYQANENERSAHPQGTITLCAKHFKRFPRLPQFEIKNDSDIQTDYFDSDKLYITPDHMYYEDALKAYKKKEATDAKRKATTEAKRKARREGRA